MMNCNTAKKWGKKAMQHQNPNYLALGSFLFPGNNQKDT